MNRFFSATQRRMVQQKSLLASGEQMRVLVVPPSIPSHLYPLVPLSWAFQSAGHEVYIAGQPPVVGSVLGAGLNAIPVGGGYDLMANITAAADKVRQETGEGPTPSGNVSSMSPVAFRRYAELRTLPHVAAAEVLTTDLVPFAKWWKPDLVIADPIALAAPVLAGCLRIPLIHQLWGPQPAGSLSDFPGYSASPEDWPEELTALYEVFGVEPASYPATAIIEPGPPSLQSAELPNRLAARYMPFNGSGSVPRWLHTQADRPRVCLSWLTTTTVNRSGTTPEPLADIVASVSSLDVETVVAVRATDEAALGQLPDGVHTVVDLPLSTILPSCAAAVSHGGGGTTMTAVHQGLPQVLVPYNPGAAFHVVTLAKTGAARAVPTDPVDPNEVATAVTEVLTEPSYSESATALRQENLAQPSPSKVVHSIEELL